MSDKLKLPDELAEKFVLSQKRLLSFREACIHCSVSESWMYKQTSRGLVPHSKPWNKLIFFDREVLENFLLSNPITPGDDIEAISVNYVANNPMMKGGNW